MYSHSNDSPFQEDLIEVALDGHPAGLPPQRRSLGGIRSYLESRALEHQQILWSFRVEDEAASSAGLLSAPGQFLRVISQRPSQLVEIAIQQPFRAHAEVQCAA